MEHSPQNQQRRKRQVGTVVAAGVAAYATYKLAHWAFPSEKKRDEEEAPEDNRWMASLTSSFGLDTSLGQLLLGSNVEKKKRSTSNHRRWKMRRQRMTRCRDEVQQALEGFSPALQTTIEEATSMTVVTNTLKQLRRDRQTSTDTSDLEASCWREIHEQTLTRLLTTAYAQTILFLVLTTQVNLLGGRLLEEALSEGTTTSRSSVASTRMSTYQWSHRIVLQRTYSYFLERGIHDLVETVRKAVVHIMDDWQVSQEVSIPDFQQALDEIRSLVEDGLPVSSPHRKPRTLLRFLLAESSDAAPDELAQCILNETWDLVESPVFLDAQVDVWNTTYDVLRHNWSGLFQDNTRPWVQILTQLKHRTSSFYDGNAYVSLWEALPTVLELGDISFN